MCLRTCVTLSKPACVVPRAWAASRAGPRAQSLPSVLGSVERDPDSLSPPSLWRLRGACGVQAASSARRPRPARAAWLRPPTRAPHGDGFRPKLISGRAGNPPMPVLVQLRAESEPRVILRRVLSLPPVLSRDNALARWARAVVARRTSLPPPNSSATVAHACADGLRARRSWRTPSISSSSESSTIALRRVCGSWWMSWPRTSTRPPVGLRLSHPLPHPPQ